MNKSIYKQLVDNHFDWYYLLNIEQYKIKQMIKNFTKANNYVNVEYDIRDMKLCVSLLDIVMEKDSVSRNVYINTKNAHRFHTNVSDAMLIDFRRIKALHLYNKIKNRVLRWWW